MTNDQLRDTDPDKLLALYHSMIESRAVQMAAELGICDHLADGPRTADDLATATSCHPSALYRLLRLLAGCGLFTEVEPGRFGLTPLGEHLREDHPQSMRALMVAGERLFARVYSDAIYSVRTGAATFPQTYGEPLFKYLQHHPDLAAIFTSMMGNFSRVQNAAVTDAYDFSGAGVVVDVGGGDGTVISAILRSYPKTAGVVLELPEVAKAARERLAAAGLTDRCTVVEGDFFREIPPDGDVYLLKYIIHDWPEPQALDILRNCRQAMSPGSRLLLVEEIIPPGDAPHPSKEMDFTMLVMLQGRLRTRQEHDALLARAGFRVSDTFETASPLSVVEAVPTGEGFADAPQQE